VHLLKVPFPLSRDNNLAKVGRKIGQEISSPRTATTWGFKKHMSAIVKEEVLNVLK
jgi:hypothetical protein